MTDSETEATAAETPGNQTLIRDVAVLQFKLIVDGLRDLLLVPASLVAGIISLVSGTNGNPGSHFYQLVYWGKQSEIWIDLFGSLKNAPDKVFEQDLPVDASLDDVVAYVEAVVKKEHKDGTMTKQAKQHIDKALANIPGRSKSE